jgi:hypothetical protein
LPLPEAFLAVDDIKLLMRQHPRNKCLNRFAEKNGYIFEIAVFGSEFFPEILDGLLQNGMDRNVCSPSGTSLTAFLSNELEMHKEAMENEKRSEIKIPENLRDKLHGDSIILESLSSLGYYHLKFCDAITKALEKLTDTSVQL